MKPYFETKLGTLYHGDCLEVMPQLDIKADLCLTDPPYGIGGSKQIGTRNPGEKCKWGGKEWDKHPPSKKCFDTIFKISKNQIIWGGNYFPLQPTRCFLVWDKVTRLDFADCEMAWTSYKTSARIFTFSRNNMQGFRLPDRKHPTQKPVALMKWCLDNHSKQGDLILDPFFGSGTTGVACELLNRRWIGVELDKEYCEIAAKRIEKASKQFELFEMKE